MPPQQSPHFPDSFYRVTIKGLCVRDGKVLMIHDFTGRSNTDPSPEWELPGGGLDFGENFKDAFIREVKEEMGLEVTSMNEKPKYIWTTKRVSSRQLEWYYILVLVFRFEVKDLNFTPSQECKAIEFFSKEDLLARRADLAAQLQPLPDYFNPADFV